MNIEEDFLRLFIDDEIVPTDFIDDPYLVFILTKYVTVGQLNRYQDKKLITHFTKPNFSTWRIVLSEEGYQFKTYALL